MTATPWNLVVFDFDATLYNSPLPPKKGSTAWWMTAKSLQGAGAPGFDPRWNLDVVRAARRAWLEPGTRTALLTGRADVEPLAGVLRRLLRDAGLTFDIISLKPVRFPPIPQGQYKASMVQRWLLASPSIKSVTLWDDEEEVHRAVSAVVTRMGRMYTGLGQAGTETPSEMAGLL
jgi:hypothetical protein